MNNDAKNGIELPQINEGQTEERKLKTDRDVDEIVVNDQIDCPYASKGQKAYKVLKYAENCEEHNQVLYIVPLIKSTSKFILFIFLNIITVGLINLFIAWFPKMVLYIYYKVTTLEEATHFGIFSKDNELLLVEKKVLNLPEIDGKNNKNILKKFNLNINYDEQPIIMFEYKLFDYVFPRLGCRFRLWPMAQCDIVSEDKAGRCAQE